MKKNTAGSRVLFALTVLLANATIAGCARSPVAPAPLDGEGLAGLETRMSAFIEAELRSTRTPGCSIAFFDADGMLWQEGFGWADREAGIRVEPDSLFQIGSVSKLLTTMLSLRLAERGLMELDAPLVDLIQEFSVRYREQPPRPVTVRDLMTHHSGLPSDDFGVYFDDVSVPSYRDLIPRLAGEYAAYPPGYVFSYSNVGVSIEGIAAERAAGEDFVPLADREVFAALGMLDSTFANTPLHPERAASGHGTDGRRRTMLVGPIPAGAAWSSAEDLSRFGRMVLSRGAVPGGRFLFEETLAEAMTPQNAGNPRDAEILIGLGFLLSGLDVMAGAPLRYNGPVVWHEGDTFTQKASFALLPEVGIGVAVLMNSANAAGAVSRIAVECLNLGLELRSGVRPEAPRNAPARPVPDFAPGAFEDLQGDYICEYFGIVRIFRDASGHHFQLQGTKLGIQALDDGSFFPTFLGSPIPDFLDYRFTVENVEGDRILFIRTAGRKLMAGTRIEPMEIPSSWSGLIGDYEVETEAGIAGILSGMRIVGDNGFLRIEYSLRDEPLIHPVVALQPISENEAVTAGLGRNMGQTLTVLERGPNARFAVSGLVFRRRL